MHRKIHLLPTFLACFLPLMSQAHFTESTVEINPEVTGKLVVPAGEEVQQAVLILHGLNDHMDAVGDLQKTFAHKLAEAGIASLRFNFRGEGERNDSVLTSTLSTRVDDAEAAYQTLVEAVPKARYGIKGFSLGGLTAILTTGKHPDWFDSMVVWSSVGNGGIDFLTSADPARNKMIQEAITEGSSVLKSWVDITYTREFLMSFIGIEAKDSLANYPGSFLGIRGNRDFLKHYEPEWMYSLAGEKVSYQVIHDADHIFNVLDPENSKADQVIQLTLNWFLDTLK